jgi:glycosyltransferase involved in cell wall biosynthesis
VSTDCPSGPAEILDNGRYGELVTSYDPQALADAIARTLDHPMSAETLKERARSFSLDRAIEEYHSLIEHTAGHGRADT